jgi:glycosyltransferase involved in cell wall biosynthesis
MRTLLQKLDGYRRLGIHEWKMSRQRACERKKQFVFEGWLRNLINTPPEVLVGPNFAEFGGVRHHIEAISRYSSRNVQLVPPADIAKTLTPYDLAEVFGEQFNDYKATGVKIVHSHVYPWYIDWCQRRQRDGIFWIHTYHLNYYHEHGVNGLEQWQLDINRALLERARHADLCLSVSKWQVEELRLQHGIDATYLPNGVDVALSEKADAKRFHRDYPGAGFILYVGRNDPVKNPQEFVRLAAHLPDRRFVMVGGGLSHETLQEEHKLEIPRNLEIIGGLGQQRVQDAIAACDALVVTSKREGLPTLVMEGMAAGKSIVVPNELGCMEAIAGGEAGRIYRIGDIAHLVEQTQAAIQDHSIGAIARERVLREYDWKVIAPQLDAVYETLRENVNEDT